MEADTGISKKRLVAPVLAVLGLLFAMRTVAATNKSSDAAPPLVAPARAPYSAYVAGAGIVEASTENIAVGTPVSGVVTSVLVTPGQKVEANQPLFSLDDRSLAGALLIQQANLGRAEAELERLRALPRPEDVPPAAARVREAESALSDAMNELDRRQKVGDSRAVSEQELSQRRYAVQTARARLDSAKAELSRLTAGSWSMEIAIAEAAVRQAESAVEATKIEINRLTVRAPVSGEVLQVKIRPGEFAQAGTLATPLMLLGAADTLHVRVDIDENDAWRVRPDAPAVAFLRGNSALSTELEAVRFEPYVVPKRSLTGESTERVDTRVLQVIYRFPRGALPVYVGQLLDVYIESAPLVEPATAAS